jgi:hypothetical protein
LSQSGSLDFAKAGFRVRGKQPFLTGLFAGDDSAGWD